VELGELAELLEPLHPKNSTFPGEVLLELPADAIEEAGATRGGRSSSKACASATFPEHRARTKAQHRRAEYALRAAAMVRGGVDPVLRDKVIWWRTDDLSFWALEALVTYVRAAAERRAETVPVICGRIAVRQGVERAAAIDLDGQNARLRKHRMSASPRRTARGIGDRRSPWLS
jgi:hypothetical protein